MVVVVLLVVVLLEVSLQLLPTVCDIHNSPIFSYHTLCGMAFAITHRNVHTGAIRRMVLRISLMMMDMRGVGVVAMVMRVF